MDWGGESGLAVRALVRFIISNLKLYLVTLSEIGCAIDWAIRVYRL